MCKLYEHNIKKISFDTHIFVIHCLNCLNSTILGVNYTSIILNTLDSTHTFWPLTVQIVEAVQFQV